MNYNTRLIGAGSCVSFLRVENTLFYDSLLQNIIYENTWSAPGTRSIYLYKYLHILSGIIAYHTYVEYFKVSCMQCIKILIRHFILLCTENFDERIVLYCIFSSVGCLLFLSKSAELANKSCPKEGAKVI